MNSLSKIINGVEHDWVVHEILMQHRNMLHAQIDLLLKEKNYGFFELILGAFLRVNK